MLVPKFQSYLSGIERCVDERHEGLVAESSNRTLVELKAEKGGKYAGGVAGSNRTLVELKDGYWNSSEKGLIVPIVP